MIVLATIVFISFGGACAFGILAIREYVLAWSFEDTTFGEICYILFKICYYIVIAASVIAVVVGFVTVVVYICRWLMEAINNGYVS